MLDDVQNELREPRYSEHQYRGSETASEAEHAYLAHTRRLQRLRQEALSATAAPDWIEHARESCGAPDARCFLALGNEIVAFGRGMAEAVRQAWGLGVDPRDCVVVFARQPDAVD